MIYKNSIKILFSNFDIVWKTIVYYFLNFLLIVGLLYLCINPYYVLLEKSGLIAQIVEVYRDFLTNLNLTVLFENISLLVNDCWMIITNNVSQFWASFTVIGLILVFVRSIISNLTIMPACNSLHYYMGSMNKHGFYASYAETFKKNFVAQLCYFLVVTPVNLLYLLIFVFSLKLFNISFAMTILAIFLILVGFVLLFALKLTLFSGWIPTMVVMNYGIFKSLKVSVKNVFRIFPKAFACAIGIVLTIVFINSLVVPFTFFVGVLLTVPITYLLVSIFGMVVVYEEQGMRYYVDVYNVITPKKKESLDKIKTMRYVV